MKTKLIRSARTEEMLVVKIRKHFETKIELVSISHKEWKVKVSTQVLDDYRVIRKSSKGVSRLRFERIIEE